MPWLHAQCCMQCAAIFCAIVAGFPTGWKIFTRRKRCTAINIFHHVGKPAIIARKSCGALHAAIAHETTALSTVLQYTVLPVVITCYRWHKQGNCNNSKKLRRITRTREPPMYTAIAPTDTSLYLGRYFCLSRMLFPIVPHVLAENIVVKRTLFYV